MISVAAELAGVHPQTLRVYERKGLVDPSPHRRGSRRFTERDIERLRHIQDLTNAGLNLEGVRRVLELEAEVARLRSRDRPRSGPRPATRWSDPPPVPPRPGPLSPDARVPTGTGTADAGRTGRGGKPMASTPTAGRSRPRRRSPPPSSGPGGQQPRGHPRPPAGRPAGPARRLAVPAAGPGRGGAAPWSANASTSALGLPAQGLRRRRARAIDRDAARRPRRRPTRCATDMGDEYLSVEHLLLALADRIGVDTRPAARPPCARCAAATG